MWYGLTIQSTKWASQYLLHIIGVRVTMCERAWVPASWGCIFLKLWKDQVGPIIRTLSILGSSFCPCTNLPHFYLCCITWSSLLVFIGPLLTVYLSTCVYRDVSFPKVITPWRDKESRRFGDKKIEVNGKFWGPLWFCRCHRMHIKSHPHCSLVGWDFSFCHRRDRSVVWSVFSREWIGLKLKNKTASCM